MSWYNTRWFADKWYAAYWWRPGQHVAPQPMGPDMSRYPSTVRSHNTHKSLKPASFQL